MPGAFAHIAAVNQACASRPFEQLADMPCQARSILKRYPGYLQLGSISPDYPYYVTGDSEQASWAVIMHRPKSGDFLKAIIKQVKELQQEEQAKAFAWLCGYCAHVIADITVHPVIELKVGSSQDNIKAHHQCETHQDHYILQRLQLSELELACSVKANFAGFSDKAAGGGDPLIQQLWSSGLQQVYFSEYQSCHPDISRWHQDFVAILEELSKVGYSLGRGRVASFSGELIFPEGGVLEQAFIKDLKTPSGLADYDEIFARVVKNIQHYWVIISQAVFCGAGDAQLLNWDLDNGKDPDGKLTGWC